MGRIFITGDTHRGIDINKLNATHFAIQKELTKDDYLIICGDFGVVWDDSAEDMFWRNWLKTRNFTTLFVDGNHENFDLLREYPVKSWNGGDVSFINESVIHLKRGQVFTISGHKFFTMGGGTSIDKQFRAEGKTWWKEELPTKKEIDIGRENLEKHNWEVDFVLTHTASMNLMKEMCYIKEDNLLNDFFDELETKLKYRHWYFGHFHDDIFFDKHTLLYNRIIELKI